MADKSWYVRFPEQIREQCVLPMQQRIFERTGIAVPVGMVARRLVELGFAADTQQMISDVSSGVSDGGS